MVEMLLDCLIVSRAIFYPWEVNWAGFGDTSLLFIATTVQEMENPLIVRGH